jgi:hypothetical protein
MWNNLAGVTSKYFITTKMVDNYVKSAIIIYVNFVLIMDENKYFRWNSAKQNKNAKQQIRYKFVAERNSEVIRIIIICNWMSKLNQKYWEFWWRNWWMRKVLVQMGDGKLETEELWS